MRRLRWDAVVLHAEPEGAAAAELVSALRSRGLVIGWPDPVEQGEPRGLSRLLDDAHVLVLLEGGEDNLTGSGAALFTTLAHRDPHRRRVLTVRTARGAGRTSPPGAYPPLDLAAGADAVAAYVHRAVEAVRGAEGEAPDATQARTRHAPTRRSSARRAFDDLAATVQSELRALPRPRDRRPVLLGLPTRAGAPLAAVALLRRVAELTTDPDDLWAVDLALERLVADNGPHSGPAGQARRSLYAHLPPPTGMAPDATLWNGAPLWTTVPAGELGWRFDGRVRVPAPLCVLTVPVTNGMWAAFQPDWNPSSPGIAASELPDHPVVNVSWPAAVSFCRWLGSQHPGVRLPTDAEWEYAARAGSRGRYWCAESEVPAVAWVDTNAGGRTHRVGELAANPWGLFDVHGNVWEWVGEWQDPLLGPPRDRRAFRGGSWAEDADSSDFDRRGVVPKGLLCDRIGFRVVRPAAAGG